MAGEVVGPVVKDEIEGRVVIEVWCWGWRSGATAGVEVSASDISSSSEEAESGIGSSRLRGEMEGLKGAAVWWVVALEVLRSVMHCSR